MNAINSVQLVVIDTGYYESIEANPVAMLVPGIQ